MYTLSEINNMKPLEIKTIYNRLKSSAAKRNIPFELTLVDLNNLSYPIICPILGIPLQFNRNEAADNSYSIDRIDSTKGYTIDNIIVVSNRANKLKNNATLLEMEQIFTFYRDLQ